jgi:leader peptidase (prepilin peptidase)/N-methyltransferase
MFVATGSITLLCLLSGTLAWIDLRRGIIPDWLNLAIAGFGLVRALLVGGVVTAFSAAWQGLAIALIVWLLRSLYFRFRKVQGLGLGDVKFLGAAVTWIGLAGLPTLLIIATLTALTTAGIMVLAGEHITRQTSLSFGPFLAIALVATVALQQLSFCC